jgi:hypothetical protein
MFHKKQEVSGRSWRKRTAPRNRRSGDVHRFDFNVLREMRNQKIHDCENRCVIQIRMYDADLAVDFPPEAVRLLK